MYTKEEVEVSIAFMKKLLLDEKLGELRSCIEDECWEDAAEIASEIIYTVSGIHNVQNFLNTPDQSMIDKKRKYLEA